MTSIDGEMVEGRFRELASHTGDYRTEVMNLARVLLDCLDGEAYEEEAGSRVAAHTPAAPPVAVRPFGEVAGEAVEEVKETAMAQLRKLNPYGRSSPTRDLARMVDLQTESQVLLDKLTVDVLEQLGSLRVARPLLEHRAELAARAILEAETFAVARIREEMIRDSRRRSR